jgi:hypothetical protein
VGSEGADWTQLAQDGAQRQHPNQQVISWSGEELSTDLPISCTMAWRLPLLMCVRWMVEHPAGPVASPWFSKQSYARKERSIKGKKKCYFNISRTCVQKECMNSFLLAMQYCPLHLSYCLQTPLFTHTLRIICCKVGNCSGCVLYIVIKRREVFPLPASKSAKIYRSSGRKVTQLKKYHFSGEAIELFIF